MFLLIQLLVWRVGDLLLVPFMVCIALHMAICHEWRSGLRHGLLLMTSRLGW